MIIGNWWLFYLNNFLIIVDYLTIIGNYYDFFLLLVIISWLFYRYSWLFVIICDLCKQLSTVIMTVYDYLMIIDNHL